jgi:hypothetical protein
VIKRLFLALEKKPGEKKFYFFFIEQIVIIKKQRCLKHQNKTTDAIVFKPLFLNVRFPLQVDQPKIMQITKPP